MKKVDEKGNVFYYNENDKLHRDDGPAVEWANGDKEWWLNGKRTTKNRVLNVKIKILEQTKIEKFKDEKN
jgi:hypothetical protein